MPEHDFVWQVIGFDPETDAPVLLSRQRFARYWDAEQYAHTCAPGWHPQLVRRAVEGVATYQERRVPEPFCRYPELCAGRGYCHHDPACND